MPSSRVHFFSAAVVIGLLAALAGAVLFCFDPARNGFYPVCGFHRTTGLLCPGCGSLRALHHLLHGEFTTAFHFNALVVCAVPLLVCVGVVFGVASWRGQPSPNWFFRSTFLWWALGLVIAFAIARNLPFPLVADLVPPALFP
jgi:hypothetical protein